MTNSDTPPASPDAAPADAPAASEAPRALPALVIGHADFAAGLVSAAATISGRGELLVALTNRDAAVDEIERRLTEAADATGARVIFTDLPAGSCAFAARRLLRARPEMLVVTGVSLPALLDYVFHAELPPADAAEHAGEIGRKAVAVVRGAAAGQPSVVPPLVTGGAAGGPRAG